MLFALLFGEPEIPRTLPVFTHFLWGSGWGKAMWTSPGNLLRKAHSQAPPQSAESEVLGVEPATCLFASPPGQH